MQPKEMKGGLGTQAARLGWKPSLAEIPNTNIEILNKFELPKSKSPRHPTRLFEKVRFEHLRIRISDLFRNSCFDIRIFPVLGW